MKSEKMPKTFNPKDLYTQTEYAKKVKAVGRSRVNQMVKKNEVQVVQINGGKIIYHKS